MEEKKHLPLFGVGPIIVFGQMIFTAAMILLAIVFGWKYLYIRELNIPMKVLGVVVLVYGASLDIRAKFQSKLFEKVAENKLITDGVYAIVRNPVYSAALLECTGAVLFTNRLFLLFVPVVCWIYMTIFLVLTEEKWLVGLYGEEYVAYCKRVNRCIPNPLNRRMK